MSKGDKSAVILERIDGLREVVELKTENLCERIDEVQKIFGDHDKEDMKRFESVMVRIGALETKVAVQRTKLTMVTSAIATAVTLGMTALWNKLFSH